MKLILVFSVKIKRLAADFRAEKLLLLPEPRVFRQLAWNSLKAKNEIFLSTTTKVRPPYTEIIAKSLARDELLIRDINYDSSDK